jgi:predicted metal-dependent enzyme (double-stranded beta helix superfamily)
MSGAVNAIICPDRSMKLEQISRTQPATLSFTLQHDSALQRLCHEIDAAFDSAERNTDVSFGQRVRMALQRAVAAPDLLQPHQRLSNPDSYCRHLLAADPLERYAIAALVWEPGQQSPVHGHQTWCGYAVIEGALSETLYAWDAETHRAVQTRSHPRDTGAVSYVDAGRGAIHQLGNPAHAQARAVSIHVYGVAGSQIATHVNDLLAA